MSKHQIGWYNGWHGDERLAVIPVIKAAVEAGTLAPPSRCSICLVDGTPDWRARDAIGFHDEDYANPLNGYPICRPCHRLIHLRFWRVEEWHAHVARLARGGQWFELLSMNPNSRFRPFAETYPEGLPLAFAAGI